MAAFFFIEENAMKNRSIIYIGGFNPYYDAVKNMPWKWLDIERCFSLLLPDNDIQIIK